MTNKIRLSTEKKTAYVSEDELVNEFKGITKTQFASVTTNTEPHLNRVGRQSGLDIITKIGCAPSMVVKVSKYVGNIAFDYSKSMSNALVKEGSDPSSYKPNPSWHVPYEGSKVIHQHKTNGGKYFYIQMVANSEPTVEYYDTRNNSLIPTCDLEEFLAPSYPTKVDVRLIKVENLVEVSACGKVYEVV